jgi:hypothetical protein
MPPKVLTNESRWVYNRLDGSTARPRTAEGEGNRS